MDEWMKREKKKRKFQRKKTEFCVDCRTTCDGVKISMPRLKRFINFQQQQQHEYEHGLIEWQSERKRKLRERERIE